ncbi:hypothetical protein [Paenibacillus sp. YIM B09110]|uniref:hypothetical protein n=1 Tax=Paenibacillus sp. YIM B09110 TaxID=3126102 RepID=UPI00301CA371
MKASKFPVTYRGQEYRVTVRKSVESIGYYYIPSISVKVYEKRTGKLARWFPFRLLRTYTGQDNVGNVTKAASIAVRRCYAETVAEHDRAEYKIREWAEFERWDGKVTEDDRV